MAQLELHDLTVFYPGQETPALRGVTASLEAGEFEMCIRDRETSY